MALVIRASSFFVKRYLKVTDWGVEFMETAALGGKRRFQFGEIDYILMSRSSVLSLQVRGEVFSIPTKPTKAKHRLVIDTLQQAVASSQQRVGGFPVLSNR